MDASNPNQSRLSRIRRWSNLLDRAFRLPGTGVRFGWDAILGLVPGVGDAIGTAFSVMILFEAMRLPIPGVVRARMLLNVLIDVAVGLVPVAGDLFDFAWKANARNLALLERHALGTEKSLRGDWLFVLGIVGLVVLGLVLPVLALGFVLEWLLSSWGPSGPGWRLLLSV
jgi:hypothetical protein